MNGFLVPGVVAVCCDLAIDGVQIQAVRMVDREVWENHSSVRAHVEQEVRRAAVEGIVAKLMPPVYEARQDTLPAETPISRAEATRLAQAYTSALTLLASRLEAAGENYALLDARRAVDAGRLLVEKLESDVGRLSERR